VAEEVKVKAKKRGRQSSITRAMQSQFDQIAELERQMMQPRYDRLLTQFDRT